jgi:hypothetical protein
MSLRLEPLYERPDAVSLRGFAVDKIRRSLKVPWQRVKLVFRHRLPPTAPYSPLLPIGPLNGAEKGQKSIKAVAGTEFNLSIVGGGA